MATTSTQMTSPFLCSDVLNGLEVEFSQSIGLDNIAYQHAQFYDAVDLLIFQKFENEKDRLNFIHDVKRLNII